MNADRCCNFGRQKCDKERRPKYSEIQSPYNGKQLMWKVKTNVILGKIQANKTITK
jgi:hypothetical protein